VGAKDEWSDAPMISGWDPISRDSLRSAIRRVPRIAVSRESPRSTNRRVPRIAVSHESPCPTNRRVPRIAAFHESPCPTNRRVPRLRHGLPCIAHFVGTDACLECRLPTADSERVASIGEGRYLPANVKILNEALPKYHLLDDCSVWFWNNR
jgi:hypothetical protein